MPTSKIEVTEYECVHCGYKWINRVNGKDGLVPERCAKCKRWNWNKGEEEAISDRERGLRTRIKHFERLYKYENRYLRLPEEQDLVIDWPDGLCERFLNLNPRPTKLELEDVIYSSPLGRFNNGSDVHESKRKYSYIPDPDNPGYLKYDKKRYRKLLKQEAQIRQELMQQIIDQRNR
jgi:hypothetical protein